MSADAISTTATTPATAAAAATPGKAVVAGFDALLAALFGAQPTAASPQADTKTQGEPDPKDASGDANVAILGIAVPVPLIAIPITVPQTDGQASAQAGPRLAPATPVFLAGQAQATPGAVLAANLPGGAATSPPQARTAASDAATTPAPATGVQSDVAVSVVGTALEPAPAADNPTPAATAQAAATLAPAPKPVITAPKSEAKAQATRAPAAAPSADAANTITAKAPDAPVAALASADNERGSGQREDGAPPQAAAPVAANDAAPAATPAPLQADAATAPSNTPPPVLPRANAETVNHLAAQIAGRTTAKSTQFDIALDPAGLGKVDVRVQIAADGALTASLAFATPHAASELRARAGELQQALQQAGFDLADGALSFDVSSQGGGGQSQAQAQVYDAWQDANVRAFAGLDDLAAAGVPQSYARPAGAGGVDIRI